MTSQLLSHVICPTTQQDRPRKSTSPHFTEKSTEVKLITKGDAVVEIGPQIVRAGRSDLLVLLMRKQGLEN